MALDWTALSPALAAPAAVIDVGALTHNLERLLLAAPGKRLRLVAPSLPCPELLRRLAAENPAVQGLLVGTVAEAAFYAGLGFDDLLVLAPPARPAEARAAAALLAQGITLWSVVDAAAQGALLAEAAEAEGVIAPTLLELDLTWRPSEEVAGTPRRSALLDSEAALALAQALRGRPGLRIAGYLAYEAQLAHEPGASLAAGAVRAIVRRQASRLAPDRRGALLDGLRGLGLTVELGTGGGSAALPGAGGDPALNEVTVGRALLTPSPEAQRALDLRPALHLHTVVLRSPDPDVVVVAGGALAGPEGRPPAGLSRLTVPGWGERLCPLRVEGRESPTLGEPIVFSQEGPGLLDRVSALTLARGDAVVGTLETAAGLGFLGG